MPISIKPADGFSEVFDITKEYKAHYQGSKVRKVERRGNQVIALCLMRERWCVEYTTLKRDDSNMFDLRDMSHYRELSFPHAAIDADRCVLDQIELETR